MQLSGISPRLVLDDDEESSFSLILDEVEETLDPINEIIEKMNLCWRNKMRREFGEKGFKGKRGGKVCKRMEERMKMKKVFPFSRLGVEEWWQSYIFIY